MTVSFTVHGSPATAGSKTLARGPDGRAWMRPEDKKHSSWRTQVAQEAGRVMEGRPLMAGAISIVLEFYRPRPKGHFRSNGELKASAPRYPATKPDLTKLVRGVEDALKGVVWRDDAQVVVQTNAKLWGNARAEIHITELP